VLRAQGVSCGSVHCRSLSYYTTVHIIAGDLASYPGSFLHTDKRKWAWVQGYWWLPV